MSARGFTLIEILLVVAVITVIAGLALPLSRHTLVGAQLRLAVSAYEQCLYRAEQLARTDTSGSQWGCQAQAGLIRLFAGNTYATRDTARDEDYIMSGSLAVSGVSERRYARVTAVPQQTGTTTFQNALGQQVVIDVNTKGTVVY